MFEVLFGCDEYDIDGDVLLVVMNFGFKFVKIGYCLDIVGMFFGNIFDCIVEKVCDILIFYCYIGVQQIVYELVMGNFVGQGNKGKINGFY